MNGVWFTEGLANLKADGVFTVLLQTLYAKPRGDVWLFYSRGQNSRLSSQLWTTFSTMNLVSFTDFWAVANGLAVGRLGNLGRLKTSIFGATTMETTSADQTIWIPDERTEACSLIPTETSCWSGPHCPDFHHWHRDLTLFWTRWHTHHNRLSRK